METIYYKHDEFDVIVKRVLEAEQFIGSFFFYRKGRGWVDSREIGDVAMTIHDDYHEITETEAIEAINNLEGEKSA